MYLYKNILFCYCKHYRL